MQGRHRGEGFACDLPARRAGTGAPELAGRTLRVQVRRSAHQLSGWASAARVCHARQPSRNIVRIFKICLFLFLNHFIMYFLIYFVMSCF